MSDDRSTDNDASTWPSGRPDRPLADRPQGESVAPLMPPRRVGAGDMAKLAGFVILLVGIWLFVSPFFLFYVTTSQGANIQARDLAAAIFLVLSGLWLVRSPRRDTLACVVAFLAGLGVLLGVILSPSRYPAVVDSEYTSAILVMIAAAAHWLEGRRTRA
jgi:hypothetical protein